MRSPRDVHTQMQSMLIPNENSIVSILTHHLNTEALSEAVFILNTVKRCLPDVIPTQTEERFISEET